MSLQPSLRIGDKRIAPDAPVFIIAEIGDTHGGSVDTALRLIDAAAAAGADAVKLQAIDPDHSYIPGEPSHAIFSQLRLTREALVRLRRAADECGLILFSTPGSAHDLRLMQELKMPLIKISSGLMTNLPLIRQAAQTGLPLIMSTGMSDLEEVAQSVRAVEEAGGSQLALMHCVSLYPAPAQTLNLRAMQTLAAAFPCPVGYSDHFDGIAACAAATALGARLLEKHLTLDRAVGPNGACAADPAQLRELVRAVRDTERMLGRADKESVDAEQPGRSFYRRCLVAHRAIAQGEVVTADAVGLKRPRRGQPGLPPSEWDRVIGRRAVRRIEQHDSIIAEMIEGLAVYV